MPRRRSLVSDEVKYEIARELGFANKIRRSGDSYDYGDITSREAGLIVRVSSRRPRGYGRPAQGRRALASQILSFFHPRAHLRSTCAHLR